MTVSDVVRMALGKANKSKSDLVGVLGVSSPAAVYNKMSKESWSAMDLVKVANFTGGKLMIVYPDGQQLLIQPEIVMTDKDAKTLIQADADASSH